MKTLLVAVLVCCAVNAHAQTLKIYNWAGYIDPAVVEGFQRETGVKVDYQTYTSALELSAALDAGADFDLVVPSHFQLQRLIEQNQLQALEPSKLSRYGNLDPKLMASLAGFSGAGRYVVPYQWSTVGLVIDAPRVEQQLGKPAPASWRLLFDAQYAAQLKGCGIGWVDAPEEMFSLWMNFQGKRLLDASPRRLAEVGAQMLQQFAAVRTLDNNTYTEQLAAGQLCVSVAWSGHALQAAARRSTLKFLVPEEGGLLTVDSWAIPKNAKQPELAYRFIDYMLDARNARLNSEATHFYAPLRSDLPEMLELAKQSAELVPPPVERRRLYFLEPLSAQQTQAINRQWQAIRQQYQQQQRP